jgi:hypothetical protein
MTIAIIERKPQSDIISFATAEIVPTDHPEILPAHDLRTLGLAAAARSLGIRIADLGPLQVRRAQADLVHCPICPGHQVRASVAASLVSAA